MPDDRDYTSDSRMQADLAGEPLTASVRDVLEEHADADRRADEERAAQMADADRISRRKEEERRTVMRHTGGERRLRPGRPRRRGDAGAGPEEDAPFADASEGGADPRLLVGAVLAGLILAGGMRRVLLLGALAAGAWALYQRVIEPARDPAVVLQ